MSVVLDSGALIAIDRRDRRVGAMLAVLQRDGVPVTTSATVVAQVWRDGSRQVNLARTLGGVHVVAVDDRAARQVGELLRESRTTDIVDGHVALLVQTDTQILTSDDADIKALLRARRIKGAVVVHV